MNKIYFKPYRKEYDTTTRKPLNKGRELKRGWDERVKLRTRVRRMNVAIWLDSPVLKDGRLTDYLVVCPILQEHRKLLSKLCDTYPSIHTVQIATPTCSMHWFGVGTANMGRSRRTTIARPALRDLCLHYHKLRYYRKWTIPKWGN